MSDSDLSDAPTTPSDSVVERSLRFAVQDAVKKNSEVTVNAIRDASERKLSLETGFFRSHVIWKQKSKEVIQDEFSKTEGEEVEPAPRKAALAVTVDKTKNESSTAKKRASPATQSKRPRKKARKLLTDEENEDSEAVKSALDSDESEDDTTSKGSKHVAKRKTNSKQSFEKPRTTSAAHVAAEQSTPVRSSEVATDQDEKDGSTGNDDSEVSDVVDRPASKRRKKSSSASAKTKFKSKTGDDDPDAAQIKLLQSQLAKCGIRKVWGKELKRFETPRDKIRHLKSILSDVGMTGRFSEDKARQIKEERELQADLEAVQEGNQAWGVDGDSEASDADTKNGAASKSSRGRLIRGAKTYDFLSDDGEETD